MVIIKPIRAESVPKGTVGGGVMVIVLGAVIVANLKKNVLVSTSFIH